MRTGRCAEEDHLEARPATDQLGKLVSIREIGNMPTARLLGECELEAFATQQALIDESKMPAGLIDEPAGGAARKARLGLKVLMGALERICAGGTYVPLALSEPRVSGAVERARPTPWPELTRRQRDVLALVSEGKSNKLIGDALNMTESTVKAHVKQIIKRLHVANRTQAALMATRTNRPSARH
jgi:DNA-binding NarL/FixJ family response regulator